MNKKILVISPTPSHPQNQGNRARIYSLLLNLKKMGQDIYFVHVQQETGDDSSMGECWGDKFYSIPYQKPKTAHKKSRTRLDRIRKKILSFVDRGYKFNYGIDDWYDESINKALIDLSTNINPDVVMVEYVFLSKALECFGDSVLKIIDTHDMFADRYKQYQKNKQKPQWFSTSKKEENKGLNRADIVIAIQDKERDVFAQRLKETKVVTMGHLVPCYKSVKEKLNKKILFIASRNQINVNGINFFIQNVFPQIKLPFPQAQLILAGDICNEVESFDGCTKLGRVENLKDAYDLVDLVINPIFFGTGLKIKNIEALGYSKPLVTTSVGAEGLEDGVGKAFLVADTATEFVNSIIKIFSEVGLYESLSKNAYKFAQQWNHNCIKVLNETLQMANKEGVRIPSSGFRRK